MPTEMFADDDPILVEFRKDNERTIAGSIMLAPCALTLPSGSLCGVPWPQHRGLDHSYFAAPPRHREGRTDAYQLTPEERAPVAPPDPSSPAEHYYSERQAADVLGIALKDLRGMLKAGTLASDRIGTVTLVRRDGVDRLVALASALSEVADDVPEPWTLPQVVEAAEPDEALLSAMRSAGDDGRQSA